MAACPRCCQEKPMLADRCPHCVADVPIKEQVEFSLFTTMLVVAGLIGVILFIFG